MEWFEKMSIEEQINTLCEMYFDYGVNSDKEVLKQAEEMKEILIKEVLKNE